MAAPTQRAGFRAWLGALAGVLACRGGALADGRDAPAAQALFDQARAWMEAGRYAEACARLEESQRLDPGAGTLYHLAKCYEADGRSASAWAAYLDVASLAAANHEPEREQLARARAAALEPTLARLAIDVPPGAAALHVTRDGRELRDVELGVPVPLDPGTHAIHAEARGALPFEATVAVVAGSTMRVMVALAAAPSARASLPASAATVEHGPAPSGLDAQSQRPGTPLRSDASRAGASTATAYGLAGTGVASLAVSAVLVAAAKHADQLSQQHCSVGDPNLCDARGVDERDRAFRLAHGATALSVVGGAALAGGLAVGLIGRARRRASHARGTHQVLLGPSSVSVRRTF